MKNFVVVAHDNQRGVGGWIVVRALSMVLALATYQREHPNDTVLKIAELAVDGRERGRLDMSQFPV